MIGNVAEWVADWYSIDYYQYCVDHKIVNDPPGPASGNYHVYRGGSWANSQYLTVSNRDFNLFKPEERPYIGFRCAKD
jgi:formylglycine-generating enzyme required for sulfatase activity